MVLYYAACFTIAQLVLANFSQVPAVSNLPLFNMVPTIPFFIFILQSTFCLILGN